MRYDAEIIATYSVAHILAEFSVRHSRGRSDCPFCGSTGSQAFRFVDDLWKCHACGEKGSTAKLYGQLAGVSTGQAFVIIAGKLGLDDSTPEQVRTVNLKMHFARVQRWARDELARQARQRRDAIEARWHLSDLAAGDYGRAAGLFWRAGSVDAALDAITRSYACRRVAGDALAGLPVA